MDKKMWLCCVNFLSSRANDVCKDGKRQSINGEDVFKVLDEIEFPEFVDPPRAVLEGFSFVRRLLPLGGAAFERALCYAFRLLPSQLISTGQIEMADEELHVHGSPGSAGSTNSCLRALAQDTQRVFRIPHRAVIDPTHEDGMIRVTILFNTSALDLGGTISDISVPWAYSTEDETAEDTTAIKAVRYVEDTTTCYRTFYVCDVYNRTYRET